jgi:hypothetical protein
LNYAQRLALGFAVDQKHLSVRYPLNDNIHL